MRCRACHREDSLIEINLKNDTFLLDGTVVRVIDDIVTTKCTADGALGLTPDQYEHLRSMPKAAA